MVYYHLKALFEQGVQITLHCFQYGRTEAKELEQFCEKVYYYERNMMPFQLFSSLPFIVVSRKNNSLLKNLLKDNAPILFEGTHCTYYINHPSLKNRKKILRFHNVEWQYYQSLYHIEKSILKKKYFNNEYKKLKKYELNRLKNYADICLAISPNDCDYLMINEFQNVHYLPPFHSHNAINIEEGRGQYVLYHGDLSILENEEIVIELIKNVFYNLPEISFVVAGRNPREHLIKIIENYANINLQANVSDETMNVLIQNAHIHLLMAKQSAGMKLKLINALYRGRFVMANDKMVGNTGLEKMCIIQNEYKKIPQRIQQLMKVNFTAENIEQRKNILNTTFSNVENAKKMINLLNIE